MGNAARSKIFRRDYKGLEYLNTYNRYKKYEIINNKTDNTGLKPAF